MPVILPETLPWRFGDWSPPAALETVEGTPLAWIPDHGELGASLLIDQFRDRTRVVAMLRALLAGVTDLDDACWQCLTERWLDTALGVQLDALGWRLDLPRLGWGEETYRLLLRAQVLTLRSQGTWPDTFGILDVLGFALSLVSIQEPARAAMLVLLGEPFADEIEAASVFRFLARAKPAGVRFVLEHPSGDAVDALTWADADAELADATRGWGDDDGTTGGVMEYEHATTEVA